MNLWLVLVMVIGGLLSVGFVVVFNMYFDCDIDVYMYCIENWLLVMGEVSLCGVLIFFWMFVIVLMVWLLVIINWLMVMFFVLVIFFYVVIYMMILKCCIE